jgi:hypothetical protein
MLWTLELLNTSDAIYDLLLNFASLGESEATFQLEHSLQVRPSGINYKQLQHF